MNYFDWKLDFPEVLNEQINSNAGFDIVIANPPYIKEYTNRDAFEGLDNRLTTKVKWIFGMALLVKCLTT